MAARPGGPAPAADDRVYTGYPAFNAHPSYAAALAGAGIDVVQTANNHALDRGPLGGRSHAGGRSTAAGLRTTGTVARGQSGPWHTLVQTRVGERRAGWPAHIP